jgi:hypothetical protein
MERLAEGKDYSKVFIIELGLLRFSQNRAFAVCCTKSASFPPDSEFSGRGAAEA